MTFSDLFSKRYGLRPTTEGLIEETVPNSARIGLAYILDELYENRHMEPTEVYKSICIALRIPRKNRDYALENYPDLVPHVEGIIEECEWWKFHDICEVIWRILRGKYDYYADLFTRSLNSLFIDEGLPFELINGKIEKAGSGFTQAQIKEARYLLKEPEFKGADKQFEKAIKAINVRPNPDVENCIKDAVGTIESVGRIITNNEKALLNDVIKQAVKKGVIPQPLDQTFTKLYAYRGSEPGVAHGAVGTSKVTVDEAEFVLTMSAAMIIYLVKKRSQLT